GKRQPRRASRTRARHSLDHGLESGPLISIGRRDLLRGSSLLAAGAALPSWTWAAAPTRLPAFYDEIERRTFRFFWETTNPLNGLVPDRWPTPSFSSIAAVGYGLGAYAVGAERGWCSRADARDRTLATLPSLW